MTTRQGDNGGAENPGKGRREKAYIRGTCTVEGTSSVFYADGGMEASKNPGWLQTAFNTLIGLFEQVGLQTNFRKTVGMVCQPCWAVRVRADEA